MTGEETKLLGVSTLGGSPKTATEFIGTLKLKGITLDEFHLIKTAGVSKIPKDIAAVFPNTQWFYHEIDIEDIDTPESARKALNVIFNVISELKNRENTVLLMDLTGGRKPMSAYLTLAAQVYCDENDRLYHVEPLDPRLRDPASPKWFPDKLDDVRLTEIPYINFSFLRELAVDWGYRLDPKNPEGVLRELAMAVNELALLGFSMQAIAHELGNEVGYLQLTLGERLGANERRALENIRGLLEYIMLFGQAGKISREKVSIRKIVSDAYRDFADKRGDNLRVEFRGNDFEVTGDPLLLRRVFRNLFDNSFKAGAKNVIILASSDGKITISDDGEGVPPDVENYLFSLRRTGKKGKGVGLLLVKKILEKHGATIEFIRDGEKGATFRINFKSGGDS